MVEHFLNIHTLEWRRVSSQIKKYTSTQNVCLAVPAPNVFYGNSSQLHMEKC